MIFKLFGSALEHLTADCDCVAPQHLPPTVSERRDTAGFYLFLRQPIARRARLSFRTTRASTGVLDERSR